jgi:beta-lactamase class A
VDVVDLLGRPALADTRWSIEVRAGADAPVLCHHPDRLLRTASVGKVFLLVEVADRIERGLLDPAEPVRRGRVAPVADSGLWQHLATPELPLADAACLVGAVSDNWATNALLDVVGLVAVRDRARALAPGGSMLHDLVRDDRGAAHPPTLSEGCAADWAALMAGLERGSVVSRAVSARVLAWLATGVDLSMVASALLLDPLAHTEPDRGVRLWNKTGTDSSARADVGVVRGPAGPVAYAAICTWHRGDDGPRAAVVSAMREIGDVVAGLAGAG